MSSLLFEESITHDNKIQSRSILTCCVSGIKIYQSKNYATKRFLSEICLIIVNPQIIDGMKFGDFVLDVKGRRLLREGTRVALSPLEFKLFETLLKNRDRVLTGDELRILVWSQDPSRQVLPAQDVNALYVSIRKLRAALGDAGKWIVNIPKVGYTISSEARIGFISTLSREMPDDPTPFVGRENEIELVRRSLAKTRLVTLTGPPGVGKSRLAREAVRSMADRFSAGIHFIDLTSIEDGQYVTRAVLSSFGLPDSHEIDLKDRIAKFFNDRSFTIILDNCEHVIERVSAVIDVLIASGRNINVIATSREPLMLPNETVIALRPLALPAMDGELPVEQLAEFEAVKLFIELARQQRPDLEIGSRDIPSIAELCKHLEGMPIAIELAAAQVDAYSVQQIVALLRDSFQLLRRRGGETSRHKTLDAAIDWSFNLLPVKEQLLFQRLSVLKGGWTAAIASKVCSDDKVSDAESVHLLASLVRRSLIQMYSLKGSHRYNMLEMVRQYSKAKLSESGDWPRMLKRRTAVFVDLVERSFDEGDCGEWPAILGAEYDSIRAVLTRTIDENDDIASGLRLCGSLSRFWFNHGHITEAQTRTKKALAKDDGSDLATRAKVLMAAGLFFGQTPGLDRDTELRRSYFEESILIWERLDDKRNLGPTLVGYAYFLNRHGEYAKAIEVAERSVEVLRETDSPILMARATNNLALTLLETGEFQRALPMLEKALRNARGSNDVFLEAVCLHNLAELARHMKEFDNADNFAARCLELFESLGQRPHVARTKLQQSEIAASRGEISRALAMQKGVLAEFSELGDNQGIADTFSVIAATISAQDSDHELALMVDAAAGALRSELKIGVGPAREKAFSAQLRKSRNAISKAAAESAASKGRTLSVAQVIELIQSQPAS